MITELVMRTVIAERLFGLDCTTQPKHTWQLNTYDDEIDYFGFASEWHNGPRCTHCGYYYCHHCEPGEEGPCTPKAPHFNTLEEVSNIITTMGKLCKFASMFDNDTWTVLFYTDSKSCTAQNADFRLAVLTAAYEYLW